MQWETTDSFAQNQEPYAMHKQQYNPSSIQFAVILPQTLLYKEDQYKLNKLYD